MGSKKHSHTDTRRNYALLRQFKKSKDVVNDATNLKKK
jgi:hypothetical protein